MPSDRACILTLRATFEDRWESWGLGDHVDVIVSPTMHDLYLTDFPRAWADPALRRRLAVIGAADYFHKWRGDEFAWIEDGPLAHLLECVEPRHAAGAVVEGRRAGLPLAGGNHQLLFANRRLGERVPASFDELLGEARRLREAGALLWPFVYPTNACYFLFPLLYGLGAPLWSDPDRPAVGIPREPLRRALELHRRLQYDEVMLPVKWEQYHAVFEFQTRRAAFCFGGDWDLAAHRRALGDDLVVAPIPALDRPCLSTASCSYLFLSRELEPRYAASLERAAARILDPEVQQDLLRALQRFPSRRGVPLDLSAAEGGAGAGLARSHEVFSSAVFLPPLPVLSHVFHVLADLMEPGVLVRHDLDDLTDRALAKMQDPRSTIALKP